MSIVNIITGLAGKAVGAYTGLTGGGAGIVIALGFAGLVYIKGSVDGYQRKEAEIAKLEKKFVPIEIKTDEKVEEAKDDFEEKTQQNATDFNVADTKRLIALAKEQGKLQGAAEGYAEALDAAKKIVGSCLNNPDAWSNELRLGARARHKAVHKGSRADRRSTRSESLPEDTP